MYLRARPHPPLPLLYVKSIFVLLFCCSVVYNLLTVPLGSAASLAKKYKNYLNTLQAFLQKTVFFFDFCLLFQNFL